MADQLPTGFVPDGVQPDTPPPDFRAENEKDATGQAVVDPNTVGTALRHFWAGVNPVQLGQMLPFPKALGGSGMENPLLPSNIAQAMHAVKLEGDAAWAKGDKVTAAAKYIESVVPLFGPMMSHWGNEAQQHQWAALTGDAAALTTNLALPKILETVANNLPAAAPDVAKADRLEREAEQAVSQRVLAPANPKFKPSATHLAPGVLTRGLSGDRIALQQAAEQGMADSGAAIDQATQAMGGTTAPVPVKPILTALNDRIAEYQVGGSTIPTAAGKVSELESLRDYLQSKGPTLPLSDILKARDEFYETADQAGGYARAGNAKLGDTAWAAREAGSAIRQHLADLSPAAADARADYTFWKSLHDVLDPDLGRPKSGAPSQGVTGGRMTTGAVAAQALANTPVGKAAAAVGLTKILPMVQDLIASPQWQLAKASQKYSLAKAIRAGQPGVVQGIALKIASLGRGASATAAVSEAARTPIVVPPMVPMGVQNQDQSP